MVRVVDVAGVVEHRPIPWRRIKAIAFDGDGTFYRGNHVYKEMAELAHLLRLAGKELFLLSNTSSGERDLVQSRVKCCIRRENVIRADYAVSDYLLKKGFLSVYVVGSASFKALLRRAGISVNQRLTRKKPSAVVVGYTEKLSFRVFTTATRLLLEGLPLIVASIDRVWLSKDGLKPGIGLHVHALANNLGIKPFVVGKPNTLMAKPLLKVAKPSEIVVFGDTLETDVGFAKNIGAYSVFIAHGIPQPGRKYKPDVRVPFSSLASWVGTLKKKLIT